MKKGVTFGLLGLAAGGAAAGGVAALVNSMYQQVMVPSLRDPAQEAGDPAVLQEGRAWARKAEGFRSAVIQSVEGFSLWAAHVPAKADTHRWAVCLHGRWDDHTSLSVQARHYHDAGWNVLLPDQRGHGRSEGKYVGWGYDERLDLIRWISWIIRRDAQAEILLHGVSMGAATVLMATGGPLPHQVKAAVSDCSYTTAEESLHHMLDREPRTPPIPGSVLFPLLRRAVLRRTGLDLRHASPLRAVEHSRTPTLFLHGTRDDTVPPAMLPRLTQAARCPKRMVWIPDAGHADAVCAAPELYWSAVDELVNAWF